MSARKVTVWTSLTVLSQLAVGGCNGSRSTVVPPACAVATDRDGPFPVTVRFSNDGSSPLFLRQGCVGLEYGISSCAGGYRDALGPAFHCACSCADSSCKGSVSCGPCAEPTALVVAAGEAHDLQWDAIRVSETDRGTYRCVGFEDLPAARYRLAVDVYDNATDAVAATAGRVITVDFPLPIASDIVEVPLAGPVDRCDADPTAAAPACTAGGSREVACEFTGALTWFGDGGLRLSTDSSNLSSPARYTLTRRFLAIGGSAESTASCATDIPRCSRDARVVTTADLIAALEHPDVKAALGRSGSLVYGLDTRPSDGSILIVERNGASVGIGGPCGAGDGTQCQRALPAGLAQLARMLSALDSQLSTTPACRSLPTTAP